MTENNHNGLQIAAGISSVDDPKFSAAMCDLANRPTRAAYCKLAIGVLLHDLLGFSKCVLHVGRTTIESRALAIKPRESPAHRIRTSLQFSSLSAFHQAALVTPGKCLAPPNRTVRSDSSI